MELRGGDVGWALFPEALDPVIADRYEITQSSEPEPLDIRLTFDLGWAMHPYAV